MWGRGQNFLPSLIRDPVRTVRRLHPARRMQIAIQTMKFILDLSPRPDQLRDSFKINVRKGREGGRKGRGRRCWPPSCFLPFSLSLGVSQAFICEPLKRSPFLPLFLSLSLFPDSFFVSSGSLLMWGEERGACIQPLFPSLLLG